MPGTGDGTSQGLDAHNVLVTVPTGDSDERRPGTCGPDCHTSREQTSPCVQGALFYVPGDTAQRARLGQED